MMNAADLPPGGFAGSPPDRVAAVSPYLRDDDELLRCAAARALGATADARAAPALVEALMDEDPDLRVDAMAALVACARPQDAQAIRRSLMGDPVKEVKVFAVEALGRLADSASVPLFCALAKDRCSHDVAWEDEAGMWDDWLDVQLAVIRALGDMGVGEAIDTLLEARSDEMGQELDPEVFGALSKIPEGGVAALFGLLRDRNAKVRQRAFAALSKAVDGALAPLENVLIEDASPEVRCLAIDCLDPDSASVARLALRDPDAGVRRATLRALAPRRIDIARSALGDEDEEARAIALSAMVSGQRGGVETVRGGDLLANVQAWAETAGPVLAAAAVEALPRLGGAEAEPFLCSLAEDGDRPVTVRAAALQALAKTVGSKVIDTLRNAATDPVRQVRAAALGSLAGLANCDDADLAARAATGLADAMSGRLLDPETRLPQSTEAQETALGAPKTEGEGSGRRITITREGDIVPTEEADGAADNVVEGNFPQSTLSAVPHLAARPHGSEEEARSPASKQRGKARRRVAVDGPDDIGFDLRLIAVKVAADCPGEPIELALANLFDVKEGPLREAAFAALAQRAQTQPLSSALVAAAEKGLGDPDPVIRGHAARAVASRSDKAADLLSALLDDPDALVRATALEAVGSSKPEIVIGAFQDDSALVRKAAMACLRHAGNPEALREGLGVCALYMRQDSLTEACKKSPDAERILLEMLAGPDLELRQRQVVLEAFAST
ncbi:HEAT repeat domain-containing protein [Pelagibius sp.]|uniref:HEAT repeat domain-containing protein n=1 Tax=Pelagibius sp. TaxID=1931238 RepID=UPI003BAF5664